MTQSSANEDRSTKRPAIVVNRKIKRHVEEESRGTWKIVYADFVTALMAFFVLMWLLSATALYNNQHFNPYALDEARTQSPQGGVIAIFDGGMMGGSSLERTEPEDGGDAEVTAPMNTQAHEAPTTELRSFASAFGEGSETVSRFQAEGAAFRLVRENLRSVLERIETLQGLSENVSVEEVPEGLRIQIVDKNGFSMFASGSDQMTARAQALLAAIGTVIEDLPNKVAISGHTDSVPYRGQSYSNWELSSDRAHAARRLLMEVALEHDQIERVDGYSDTRPFIEEDPRHPSNRRISLLLLRRYELPPVLHEHYRENPAAFQRELRAMSNLVDG